MYNLKIKKINILVRLCCGGQIHASHSGCCAASLVFDAVVGEKELNLGRKNIQGVIRCYSTTRTPQNMFFLPILF